MLIFASNDVLVDAKVILDLAVVPLSGHHAIFVSLVMRRPSDVTCCQSMTAKRGPFCASNF